MSRYARALAQRGISDFEMSAVVAGWFVHGSLRTMFTGWVRSRRGCFRPKRGWENAVISQLRKVVSEWGCGLGYESNFPKAALFLKESQKNRCIPRNQKKKFLPCARVGCLHSSGPAWEKKCGDVVFTLCDLE